MKENTLFIDLQKSFDIVYHKLLCNKLECYGIRGVANTWNQSYLSNRMRYTSYDGYMSECLRISRDIPQGSVLGPQLFTVGSVS